MRLGSPNGDSRTKLWEPAGQSIQELRPLSRDQEPESCALPTSFTLPGLHPISQSPCYQPVQLCLSVTSRGCGKKSPYKLQKRQVVSTGQTQLPLKYRDILDRYSKRGRGTSTDKMPRLN